MLLPPKFTFSMYVPGQTITLSPNEEAAIAPPIVMNAESWLSQFA